MAESISGWYVKGNVPLDKGRDEVDLDQIYRCGENRRQGSITRKLGDVYTGKDLDALHGLSRRGTNTISRGGGKDGGTLKALQVTSSGGGGRRSKA